MATLLHIESSAAGQESVSRRVAKSVRAQWVGEVIHRDLGVSPVPPITAEHVVARRTDPAQLTTELKEATQLQDALIAEFLDADAYLLTVPMYNYAAPASFKAWIDQIVVLGRTLNFPPPSAGRPAVVVSARGAAYGSDTPNSNRDFVMPWLQVILGDTLGLNLRFITPEYALAATHPAMSSQIPAFEDSLRITQEQAHAEGRRLTEGLVARV